MCKTILSNVYRQYILHHQSSSSPNLAHKTSTSFFWGRSVIITCLKRFLYHKKHDVVAMGTTWLWKPFVRQSQTGFSLQENTFQLCFLSIYLFPMWLCEYTSQGLKDNNINIFSVAQQRSQGRISSLKGHLRHETWPCLKCLCSWGRSQTSLFWRSGSLSTALHRAADLSGGAP